MLRLPPSSMHRTVACAGWAAASQGAVEPESDYTIASEGIAIHSLIEKAINENLTDLAPFIGTTDSRNTIYTDEMIDGAVTILETLYKCVDARDVFTQGRWGMEEWLNYPHVISAVTVGKPDFFYYDAEANTLHIADFKWGHVPVEAVENWQLLSYAALLKEHLKLGDDVRYILHVIQPRCFDGSGEHKRWTCNDITPYVTKMREQTAKALEVQPELVTGDHCRYCPAVYRCPALRQQSTEIIEVMIDKGGYMDIDDPTPADVGAELTLLTRAEAILKNKLKAMEAHAEILLKQGQDVEGWQLTDKKSAAKWGVSEDEVRAMALLFGVDFNKPTEIMSPTQAKKKLKENSVDESVISGMITHGITKTLSKFDINYAKTVFGGQ